MKRRSAWILCTAISASSASFIHAAVANRKWDAADSVSCEYLAQNLEFIPSYYSPTIQTDPFRFSPNGQLAVFASWRGRIETDENEVMLHLASADPRSGFAYVKKLVLRGSTPFPQTITDDIQWERSSDAIRFKSHETDCTRLWRWDVKTEKAEVLREWKQRIRPVILHDGQTIIFQATDPRRPHQPEYPVSVIEVRRENANERRKRVFGSVTVEQQGSPPWQISAEEGIQLVAGNVISADGKTALVVQERRGERPMWAVLDITSRRIVRIADIIERSTGSPPLFGAIDEAGDNVVITSAARLGGGSDSKAGTWLYNLRSGTGRELPPEAAPCKAFAVSADNSVITVWKAQSSEHDRTHVRFRWSATKWERTDEIADERPNSGWLELGISASGWPQVTSRGPGTPQVLYETNSNAEIAPLRWTPITWCEPDGSVERAGLLLPADASSKRLPLVIQNYGFFPEEFLPDGPAMGACDAAQLLASRGIAVLQINSWPDRFAAGGAAEGVHYRERVERAVAAAAASASLDLSRVGISGFSRAGYLSLYLATHPPSFGLLAAVCDDSYSGSYSGYLASGVMPVGRPGEAELYGGQFWQNKAGWLAEETTFNFDRITAALLFTVKLYGASDIRSTDLDLKWSEHQWPIALLRGGLRHARRAHEFLVFPKGAHQLQRPSERLALLSAVSDWFAFWLKAEPPLDRERAARWAILRKQQDEVLKTPPPPKGKWVFQPDAEQPAWTPPTDPNAAAGSEKSDAPAASPKK